MIKLKLFQQTEKYESIEIEVININHLIIRMVENEKLKFKINLLYELLLIIYQPVWKKRNTQYYFPVKTKISPALWSKW